MASAPTIRTRSLQQLDDFTISITREFEIKSERISPERGNGHLVADAGVSRRPSTASGRSTPSTDDPPNRSHTTTITSRSQHSKQNGTSMGYRRKEHFAPSLSTVISAGSPYDHGSSPPTASDALSINSIMTGKTPIRRIQSGQSLAEERNDHVPRPLPSPPLPPPFALGYLPIYAAMSGRQYSQRTLPSPPISPSLSKSMALDARSRPTSSSSSKTAMWSLRSRIKGHAKETDNEIKKVEAQAGIVTQRADSATDTYEKGGALTEKEDAAEVDLAPRFLQDPEETAQRMTTTSPSEEPRLSLSQMTDSRLSSQSQGQESNRSDITESDSRPISSLQVDSRDSYQSSHRDSTDFDAGAARLAELRARTTKLKTRGSMWKPWSGKKSQDLCKAAVSELRPSPSFWSLGGR